MTSQRKCTSFYRMQSTAASAPEPKTSLENPESVAPSESAEHKRSAASSFTRVPVWIIIIITIIIVPPTATKPLMVLLTPVGSNIRPSSFCKTRGSVHTSQPNHRFREHDGGSKSWIRHSPLPTMTLSVSRVHSAVVSSHTLSLNSVKSCGENRGRQQQR